MSILPLRSATARALLLSILALIAFAAFNIGLGAFSVARIDLTRNQLYSLDPVTLRVLDGVQEPITLRLYYSQRLGRELPAYEVYAQRVRELLVEIAAASDGRVVLELYDPAPFTAEEDRAVAFGLQAVPLDASGEQVYFGLVGVNSTDDEQVIPFFQPETERLLHYDLTRMLYTLANPSRPRVGIVSALPLAGGMGPQGGQTPPFILYEQLEGLFDVEVLGVDFTAIDPGLDVLMLAHPEGLADTARYAIDQFALAGKPVLAFVDPHSEVAQATAQGQGGRQERYSSDLPALLASWGVDMADDVLLGDRAGARRVGVPGAGGRTVPVDYVLWASFGTENLSAADSVFAELQLINLGTPGLLSPLEDASTTFIPVLTSSADSMEIAVAEVLYQPDPVGLYRRFEPSGAPAVLAARLSGPATSAFPNGAPAAEDADAATTNDEPAHLNDGTINVLVLADSDLLADTFWVDVYNFFGQREFQPIANNGALVVNNLEAMAGAPDLSALRGRGLSASPFVLVEDIRRAAEAEFRATEQRLNERLGEITEQLRTLQTGGGGEVTLTAEQEAELVAFENEMLDVRQELRMVQRALVEDVEALQGWVQFLNIGLMPLLIMIGAAGLALVRAVRRAGARRLSAG